ncbi:MAG TPA: extracellular solute-binding protein [Gaiellaceae bacterium]|nr:extracellular solute-binding protein [Gaiellaceae bacterium]
MLSTRRLRAAAGLAVAALAAVIAVSPGSSATGQARTVRIWVDNVQKPAMEQITASWAASRNVRMDVVVKDFGKIRDDLKTVQAENAPDVIVGPHDWSGELAANGLVVPIFPSAAVRKQFPSYALDAFSYGTAVKRLYGAPFALENVGLVVNTRLARVPKTFDDFQRQALAFKKKARGNIALAVPQGAGGDAYHMYPFFSGLGGYIFGRNKAGNYDVSDIGLANRTFLQNASLIDQWNRTGFINSKIDYGTGKDAFLKGKAAFWITGPWETNTLKQSRIKFTIIQVPRIKFRAVPFLGVQGYMVTKYAAEHGVESLAKDLVGSYITSPSVQRTLAAANGRYPANVQAGRQVRDPVLLQFGRAGEGGVPMPNIPQMASVWSELGQAWVKATRGPGAVPARIAFQTAARNIANKIG